MGGAGAVRPNLIGAGAYVREINLISKCIWRHLTYASATFIKHIKQRIILASFGSILMLIKRKPEALYLQSAQLS